MNKIDNLTENEKKRLKEYQKYCDEQLEKEDQLMKALSKELEKSKKEKNMVKCKCYEKGGIEEYKHYDICPICG